jgi:4-hydroxy-3-methylbut-2-enyl diphosphate reductase
MNVTIETKARPCPGVERAIALAEDVLNRGEVLYAIGELIHNRREIERLHAAGLHQITLDEIKEDAESGRFEDTHYLVRTHGETENVLSLVREAGMKVVDATCPIVRHSQELVDQHVKEGWGIVIAGNHKHPEVIALLERTKGKGIVVSSTEEVDNANFDERSFLLAQTTIDPELFTAVRKSLSKRMSQLKIVDTTCRFIQNRQRDVSVFAEQHDVVFHVGGLNSSNCRLLHAKSATVNPMSYRVEGPNDVDRKWLKSAKKVGITGGASTPRWQLEELKSYLNNHHTEKNPKGLKNRKGGKRKWWNRKNQN